MADTSPLNAAQLVNEAWDYYREIGNEWLEQATTTIADLNTVNVEPISFSVNYNVDSFLPTFVRPTKPTIGTLPSITPLSVAAPTLDDVEVRVLEDAPAEPDLSGFGYAPPTPPNQAAPTAPSDVDVQLVPIEIPERDDFVLPDVPTLLELGVVEVEAVVLPTFDGVRPTFDIDLPEDGALAWTEERYTSDLATELTTQIRSMLTGSLGLPPAIEQAIFDRGRAREDRAARKLVQEIDEDLGARGLTEPNGIRSRRLQEARQANREAVGRLNESITIESAKLSIENVKFAVGQGMAWEQVLIQQNLAINDRALRAALAVREYGIQRVNAAISLANLEQQAYATDAQVFRVRLEGALAVLEKTKAEIDVQRLRGEQNRDLIAQYTAQLGAIKVLAELYQSDVEAAKAKGEINNQRIAAGKLLVERYAEQVRAWGGLHEAYKAQVEGALGTVKFGEVLAGMYATRMQGYKTKGEAYFNEGRFKLERNGQTLDLFKANLAGAEQDLRGQLAQLDAVLKGIDANVRLYEADGSIAQAESAAYDRITQLKIASEDARANIELKQADIRIQQAVKIGEILVEQIKAKAAAISQLAAASQSGVNFGASLSGSIGIGYNYGQNFSYSGDTKTDKDPYF